MLGFLVRNSFILSGYFAITTPGASLGNKVILNHLKILLVYSKVSDNTENKESERDKIYERTKMD